MDRNVPAARTTAASDAPVVRRAAATRLVALTTALVAAAAALAAPAWGTGPVATPAAAPGGQAAPAGPAAPDRGRPGRPAPTAGADFVDGELLVRFDPARAPVGERADQALAAVDGRVVQRLDRVVPGLQRVALGDGVDVLEAMADLEARGDVLYAEPNYRVAANATPNDSRFPELWGLHNTGQPVTGVAGTPDADIDAPEAWNLTTGSAAVTVAVIDSGVAYDHPDLATNMWVNSREVAGNGLDDDGNGFVDDRRGWDFVDGDADPRDRNGHGSHVAGTIGARGNNDTAATGTTDVTGVAWNVRLMPLRVLDERGQGTYANLIAGIDYASRNGARIANLSLGGEWISQAMYDALRAASNVLHVVAAGNDGWDLELLRQFPCEFDLANIVCVTATDADDQLATFSNWSSTSVDVAAPGVGTLSTWPFARVFFDDFETPTDGRWVMGGTPDTWGRTTSVPAYGATTTWLTDSPTGFYPDSSDNWARTTALDLRGTSACVVHFNGVFDVESYFDFARLEVAKSTSGPWTEIGSFTGYWPAPDEVLEAHLPASFDGASSAYLRFRLNPDEQYDGDGAYVDNVELDCSGRYSGASFDIASGTSMATPHVSGVAALVLARYPGFTTAQLRTRLLTSVDVKTSLQGKVATGGRINAHRAVR